jgi:hypothetical protein
LKPEWWGLPLVQQEKYQEKPVKREEQIIIMIIIIKRRPTIHTQELAGWPNTHHSPPLETNYLF